MRRVARVRPLAPADPALTPGRGGGAAATALHIQAEREKLHQLGNRAPHARAVTACGLEECPYCALPTATPADGDGDGLLPPRKKKRIELPTAPCTGFGPAALRPLAVATVAKIRGLKGKLAVECTPTSDEERRCAAVCAGIAEEARVLNATARVDACAGVMGELKYPARVDVQSMDRTDLARYLKRHDVAVPSTEGERRVLATQLAENAAKLPVVKLTATMHDGAAGGVTHYHGQCTREPVKQHAQSSGQCDHCREKLRMILLGRLETRLRDQPADVSHGRNDLLGNRGVLGEKTARLQQERRALKAKLKRLEMKVERMLEAHQKLDHKPRTTEQDAIAHAVMGAADMAVDENGNRLLDVHLKPGSMARIVWDTNQRNVASVVKTGNKQGCRYPPALHRLGLSLLLRCGKSAYDQLQKHFGALPGLSQMQKYENFIPQNETGVLHSMLEAMMHDVVRPNMPCHETDEQLDGEAEAESAQAMAAAAGPHAAATTVGGRRVKDKKPRRRNACVDEEWVRSVCVSFDEMTVHGDMSWNADHTRVVGGSDDDRNMELMVREYEREMATLLEDASGEPAAASHKYTAPELATKYLVFHATSMGANANDKHFSFPCARYALADINSGKVQRLLKEVICGLAQYAFVGVAVSADGAGENAGAQIALCTMPARQFYTPAEAVQLQTTYPDIDLDFKVAFPHPVFGDSHPVFWLSDMPHLSKKTRTATQHSNHRRGDDIDSVTGLHVSIGNRRDMKRKRPTPLTQAGMPTIVGQKYDTINLDMLRRAAMNESGFGLRCNFKFTRDHFFLSHVLKMRVCLAMQVQSSTMHRIVSREVGLQASGRMGSYHSRHLPDHRSYGSILQYIAHIDRLVDVCNGAKTKEYPSGSGAKPYQPISSSADQQLAWLLDTLQWFSAWLAELQQDGDLPPAEKRASFLPLETWSALQSVCLGFNCLTRHYVEPHGGRRKLVCRKCQSDCCEHHFSNCKFFAGKGAAAGNTIQVCYGATAASVASHLGGLAGGNANFAGNLSTDIMESKMWSQDSLAAARAEYAQEQ